MQRRDMRGSRPNEGEPCSGEHTPSYESDNRGGSPDIRRGPEREHDYSRDEPHGPEDVPHADAVAHNPRYDAPDERARLRHCYGVLRYVCGYVVGFGEVERVEVWGQEAGCQ